MRTQLGVLVLAFGLAACRGNSPPSRAASAPASPTVPAAAPLEPSKVVAPAASSAGSAASPAPSSSAASTWQAAPLPLPGAVGPLSLDYIFYEPNPSRVWVPAGGTGSVAVLDTASGAFAKVEGFKTLAREAHGKMRVLGPSSGAIGDGFAYIGNRASEEVCAIGVQTLKLGSCLKLAAAPDGVEYVAATREVWVTTPTRKRCPCWMRRPRAHSNRRA